MRIDANSWYFSHCHGQLCKVIEIQTLWGDTTCRVWLSGSDSVVRIPAASLKPLGDATTGTPVGITYVAAAARVADALTQDVLLAPIESSALFLIRSGRCPGRSWAIRLRQQGYAGQAGYAIFLADEVGSRAT